MFEINLVKDKAITTEIRKQYSKYLKIGIFITWIVLMIVGILIYIAVSKESRYKHLRIKVTRDLDGMIERHNISNWGREWLEIRNRITTVSNIENDRKGWVIRLTTLAYFLPKNMCIERIVASKDNKSIELRLLSLISGEDEDEFEKVKEYINMIEKSRYFDSGIKMEAQKRTVIKEKDVNLFKLFVPLK